MAATTYELRDHIADFDDFFRPIRNYFYWEPHCYDIPICWALRSVFDTVDGIAVIGDQLGGLVENMDKLDALMPQLLESLPPMLETMKRMKTMMLTMYATQGHAGPAVRHAGERDRDGGSVRRVDERRLVLSASGNIR